MKDGNSKKLKDSQHFFHYLNYLNIIWIVNTIMYVNKSSVSTWLNPYLTLFCFLLRCFPKVCESNKLSCDEGAKCLPLTWLCDSINDCNDNKDEHNCPNRRTGEDYLLFIHISFFVLFFFILSSAFSNISNRFRLCYSVNFSGKAIYIILICLICVILEWVSFEWSESGSRSWITDPDPATPTERTPNL